MSVLILRVAWSFFLAAGVLSLGYAGYIVADAHAYQAAEQRRFEKVSHRAGPRPAVERDGPRPVLAGEVIGELEVPRLGLKTIVIQGDSPRILRRAVGHLPETPLPGQEGNVALAGHRDGIFRPLRNVRPGDTITLKTPDGDFEYQVESIAVVSPDNLRVLEPTSGRTLTLITCFPFYYVGSAPHRFIVRARQLGSPEQLGERER